MDLTIDEVIDKGLYYKKISDDKVINITGEGGSGKSTLANEYKNDYNYLVVDYDLILSNPDVGTIEYELKHMLLEKYGNSLFENINKVGMDKVKENFTIMYSEIINYLSNRNKTIVLDGTQLRFIRDVKVIRGEFVVLRTSLQTCVSRSVERFIQNNPHATTEQIREYTQKRENILHQLNPMMNELLIQVDKLVNMKNLEFSFDHIEIQNYLQENSKKYLDIIRNEYGSFMSSDQIKLLDQLLATDCVEVNRNGKEYLLNQANDINNSSNMSTFEKLQALRKLNIPLAHGGRVFEDNQIHFYPSKLLAKNPNLSIDELKQKCNEVLIHELLHFFIRPEYLDITNLPELKGINSFTTEGLVDMCARDIHQKYGMFPNYKSEYGSNVIFVREALSNIPNLYERMQLVFNGSIGHIYQQTSTPAYNSQQQFINARDNETKYDEVITNISRICYPEKVDSLQRVLYNFSANFKNKNEALEAIEKVSQQEFRDKVPFIQQQIMTYKNNNDSKNQGERLKSNEDTSITQKNSFDQRSKNEIQVAEQIRIKNQAIAKQKQQQKQVDKQKVFVKTNPNMPKSSNGYVNVVILSLIVSFVAGIFTMIMYSILK